MSGDHFARPGANDRVWGALDKLAVTDPETFADYYANDVLALVSEAWLGPGYQVTSQVNVVNPGGQAQVAHRDYHLGFMDRDQAQAFPAHVHALSPGLTLQGAVAHVDMPVETGPTLYLPHSQKYPAGYLGYHDAAFTAYFEEHHVQLPLVAGDAVFFNPALFHGAGTNRTPRRTPDGQPAPGLQRVRTGDGDRGHPHHLRRGPSRAAPLAGRGRRCRGDRPRRRSRGRGLPLPHQPRPRPARRVAGSAEPGRRWCTRPSPRTGRPTALTDALDAQLARRRSQVG